MKISVEFENGMTITTKPENLQLINAKDVVVVVAKIAEGAPVPLFSFNAQIATADELTIRQETAKMLAEAQKNSAAAGSGDAVPPPAAPAVTPAAALTKKRK